MGPNTVSRLRTTASGPPTDSSRVPGVVTVVVVTLPSFAGSEVQRRSDTARAGPRMRVRATAAGQGQRREVERAPPRKPVPERAWEGRLIRVLAEPPSVRRPALAWSRGQPDRGARVPHHATCQDHPGPGRGPAVRAAPPRSGPPPRGGRPARRAEHGLLHPPREGQPAPPPPTAGSSHPPPPPTWRRRTGPPAGPPPGRPGAPPPTPSPCP